MIGFVNLVLLHKEVFSVVQALFNAQVPIAPCVPAFVQEVLEGMLAHHDLLDVAVLVLLGVKGGGLVAIALRVGTPRRHVVQNQPSEKALGFHVLLTPPFP